MNFREKFSLKNRVISMLLVFCMIFSGLTIMPTATYTEAEAAADYGLAGSIQDGVVLHCFNWKYNDIKAELPNIAAAGFTSVQTSPAQVGVKSGIWYWLYQPLGFYIGTNDLGTKEELKALCTEAEKYGINVIVDVVANHLAGDHSNIQNDLKDSQYWHSHGSVSSWADRYQVTHGEIGMPDINSEHSYVQQVVSAYINELKNLGVDGIRWDAAKHIALPSEGCNFWPAVTGQGLYHYGEILVGPDDRASGNESLMVEYTKYMTVTDSNYGKQIRDAFASGSVPSSFGNWAARGVANNKLIYWGESHDTWSNNQDWGYSNGMSQNVIDRAYAVAASRNDISALYFSRPSSTHKESILGGQKGSTHFTSPEVAEVNKFHNAKDGEKDYYTTGSNCAVVSRVTGAVVVAGSGSNFDVTVPNGGGITQAGTYIDAITGAKWTVGSTTMSGKIGPSGIAVLYKEGTYGTYPDIDESTESSTESSSSGSEIVTDNNIFYKNTNNWSTVYAYYWSDANTAMTTWPGVQMSCVTGNEYGAKIPTDAQYIIFSNGNGTQTEELTIAGWNKIYENGTWSNYGKIDPTLPDDPTEDGYVVYLNLPSGWSTPVYCYAYDSATETANNGVWPGQTMTYDSETGYYKYTVPSNIAAPRVIFYSSDSNRYPAAMEPGLLCSAEGSWLYSNSAWSQYTPPVAKGTVTVKYVDASGKQVADTVTMTGKVGSSYTTTAADVDGYTLKTSPSNATGTYTKDDITVTYVYEVIVDDTPLVVSSLATGSTFKTETETITLTLKNAVKGTYTVDDGPEKNFTSTADVVIGQGKVADSVVTVKTTAVGADGTTKAYTFTYNKQFNGTVDEVNGKTAAVASFASTYAVSTVASTSALSSKYSTNAAGFGANKTITVDGSMSDWDSSMIIAQGTANDDPRVYRDNSMYEIPIDMYTLYGAWDNENLYLMWEMTNVQDVVAPNDTYPLSQGVLFQTMNVPFFIAINTGDSSTAIGNNGQLTTGGTLWDSGITIESPFNKLIAISTNGANGPFVYGGDSKGLNPVEETSYAASGIEFNYGLGILSSNVYGINNGYGVYNGRVLGDMCNESADWVEFNSLGHSSSTMDFHYEMAIPFETLGVTAADVKANGLGVMVIATMGMSGMDCLPYDLAMNDNADLPDTQSQEFNSFEKSDPDNITAAFAYVGAKGEPVVDDLELNFGADRSAPQLAGTALTLSGIAQGGVGDYTYKFSVNGTALKTITSSSSAEVAWTPSAEGTYVIECIVTDSEGTSVTSAKYYTVEKGTGTDESEDDTEDDTEDSTESEVIVKPSKVRDLTATYKDGQIVLNWTNNGAVKYRVMRFDSITPGYTTLTYSATAGGYVDTDLIDAHRYYYRVCGYFYDESGALVQGTVSDSAGVVATDREPGKVENVKAIVSGRTVTLTWDAADGVRYYKLARAYGATAAEGSYGTLKYNVEQTAYTDTTIKYAGTFRYKVVGYYKAVDGSWTYGPMSDTLFLTIK